MNKQDMLVLFQYNQWTSQKIFDATANLTTEQFLAPASFPHGGIRSTLVHALFAEWIWRMRWEGTSPTLRFKPEEFPTFEALRTRMEMEDNLLIKFIENITDEKLNSRFKYNSTDDKPNERVLWQTMVHVVNHGTQHKTEVAAMLTELNHSPGDLDMVYLFK